MRRSQLIRDAMGAWQGTTAPAAGEWKSLCWLAAWFAASLALCIALIVWRDPAFAAVESSASIALNVLPVMLVLLLLLGISGRPLLSAWIALLLLWAIYFIDTLKLRDLGTPLMPGDALLLANLGDDGGSLLARYLPRDAKHALEYFVAIALLALLLWKERPPRVLKPVRRVVLAGAALALALTLVSGASPWKSLYSPETVQFRLWTPQRHAAQFGLFAHLVRYTWETAGPLPEPDLAAAERTLREHRDALGASAAPAPLPDIVVLQSESFFDAARLRGLEPSGLFPHYRELARVSRHGDLWVPAFGGGTIRTEFEVLTGIAMRYFPATQYPYFRLTATRVESLASVLGARGYRVLAIHPHARAFWNRAAAFANLGFGEFEADEQFRHAPRQGYYTSDEALVDRIIEQLGDGTGAPTFLFAISMENHGPYANYPNADAARRDAEPAPDGLSDAAQREVRGYLYHAENADRALGRLAAALQARSRRALLLFYGDHLPGLPDVYAETGFDDGAEAVEQPVPWLLLDTADATSHERTDTASFYLPALLLSVAGIDDAYFSVLEALRRSDQVSRGWTPAENDGLGALMQLRQRGDFGRLTEKLGGEAGSARLTGRSP